MRRLKFAVIAIQTIGMALFVGCSDKITNHYGPEDWQPPVIEWRYQPDAEVRGAIGIDVVIEDSSGVLWARLYFDGLPAIELNTTPYRFEFDTDTIADGVHILETRAIDAHGNLGISPVLRINVMNSFAQGPRVLWVPDSLATIQAAINAATDFDTIRVRDGTYYETLNLFGKGVWIESENGPSHTRIDAGEGNNVMMVPPTQVPAVLRGFTVSALGHIVRIMGGGQLMYLNNISMSGEGGDDHLITDFCGGLIQNNLFVGTQYGVQIGYFLGSFFNNMIIGVQNTAFWNAAIHENPLSYGYNLFWENGQDYFEFEPGVGDIYADPLINLEGGQLESGSPAIDAGHPDILDTDSTRSDMGPFGGPWAYD